MRVLRQPENLQKLKPFVIGQINQSLIPAWQAHRRLNPGKKSPKQLQSSITQIIKKVSDSISSLSDENLS